MNIRRKYSTMGSVELFSDMLMLFSLADSRRIVVFIDQFEEYVEYQRGAKLIQMAQDLKDLYRAMSLCGNLTFVLTMYLRTQSEFETRAGEILTTYGEIMDNAATVEKLSSEHLAAIAKAYIVHYRSPNCDKKEFAFPFTVEALNYVADNANNNPRVMLRVLGNLLREAMYANEKEITIDFIKDPKIHSSVGLGAIQPSVS